MSAERLPRAPEPHDPRSCRLLGAAVKAASKRIPIVGDRKLNDNLSFAAGTMADAYRIGAEEAQAEIIGRLRALREYVPPVAPSVCYQCKLPPTSESPLVRALVPGRPKATWAIHAGCFNALQECCEATLMLDTKNGAANA